MKRAFRLKIPLLVVVSFIWTMTALAADTITGTVRDETTGQPAVADDVVLLRLGQGMQREAWTTTDAQGAFTLNLALPDDQHVVRVLHQGVNYDRTVNGAGPLRMIVYDAVTRIPGLSGTIGIAQIESDGKLMKVTEMYAISNSSSPPVTQSRPDNFEIAVPEMAAFESVEVRSGAGMWVRIAPAPVKGHVGTFSIDFPIRPGDTLLKSVYHVPYQAPTTLHLKLPYPITNFGVMHPPSMSFTALRRDTFRSPGLAGGFRLEQAVTTPLMGDVPAFEISGLENVREHAPRNPSASPAINRPAAADRTRNELGLMFAEVMVILAVGVFAMWRKTTRSGRHRVHGCGGRVRVG
jgi:hypothetical protein